jgi:hypothetical protein
MVAAIIIGLICGAVTMVHWAYKDGAIRLEAYVIPALQRGNYGAIIFVWIMKSILPTIGSVIMFFLLSR